MPRSVTQALSVLTAALMVAALSACSTGGDSAQPADADGTLHVARSESFDGWDPDKAAAYSSYQTLQGVLEPLLRFSPDGTAVEAGLAKSWSYDPAALTWTFVLQDDTQFSDGTPLTSADVAFSAGVWADGSNYGSLYANITGVSTPDDRTAVFALATPDTTLPVLMTWSSSAIFPTDFGGKTRDEYFAKPVAAGAFVIADWSPGGQITLEKNEHYYQPGRPYLEKVVIDVLPDATERGAQFQAGQIDISEYVGASDAKQYGDSLVALPAGQVEHLSFNTTRAPLDDPQLRKAIAYAIDYDAITDGAFRGYGSAPRGIIPPNLANWAPPSEAPFALDLDRSKELLDKSESADVDALEVVYDAGNSTDHLVAQVIKANLAEIGIDVTLTALETGAFLSRAYGLDADMVLWSYGAVSPDVIDPLGWIQGTSWLFTGFETDTIQQQFFAYTATESPEEKQQIVTAVQDEALENAQAISLSEFQVLHAVSPRISGFAAAPWGMYYWDTIKVGE
ncbi:peptide/nickel transport system substrate-binding protein [Microterricola gilva]|uniref:Peptide/nickel transport system substrate-binding protein n=1 Tax=Microterricola gilva TaxID=393267 RepID=A0A4Q8AMV7_9MICO|nr:ABC transporter substrate-binding protein [Microterricola gilva]RZU65363.1 peptide/nickel transport system substrate-binding protein [Microterricola gilva]